MEKKEQSRWELTDENYGYAAGSSSIKEVDMGIFSVYHGRDK